MIAGNFTNVTLNNVVGYRISSNWTPIIGFQSYFYVYVWDMENPGTKFAQAVNVGTNGIPTRGNLILEGGQRTYQFNNIDLLSAQVGATRRFRYRLLEFRYDNNILSSGSTPISIENDGTDQTALGGLGTDYQYALDDGAENLLGFRYRPAAAGANVVRFSALRNNQNCFLKKVIKSNDDRIQSPNQPMSTYTITFSQGNLDVTAQNLQSVYVDEAFGYMLGEPQPPLSTLVQGGDSNLIREAVTSKMEDYAQRELLKFDVQQDPVPRESDSRTVETATYIFKQGNYQNLQIT